MTVDWSLFFPPGERVLALPSWQRPRLYLPLQSFTRRWEGSSLYPASRFRARLYRFLLRTRAATGLVATRTARSSDWLLEEFIHDVLPRARAAAALVGVPNPTQKITVRLQDEKDRVVGYLKYAEKEAARSRLHQEHRVLSTIPRGLGPEVLKYGTLGDGRALLITPLAGRILPATLPPARGVVDFLNSLTVLPPVSVEAHPWVRRIQEQNDPELDSCFEVMSRKNWPVVMQHGDFVPWNLLRRPDGSIGAVDWEWGTLESFPYLDLAYYILRVSNLVYRWAPRRAARYTVRYLTEEPRFALDGAEAWAMTRLAAYDVCQKTLEYGPTTDKALRAWHRAVWESRA